RAWETRARVQSRSGRATLARASADHAVSIAQGLVDADVAYWYDLACALALRARLASSNEDAEASLNALRAALGNAFDNRPLLEAAPRLDGVRSRAGFPTSAKIPK